MQSSPSPIPLNFLLTLICTTALAILVFMRVYCEAVVVTLRSIHYLHYAPTATAPTSIRKQVQILIECPRPARTGVHQCSRFRIPDRAFLILDPTLNYA